ncbi:MAG: aminotransferase class I/II-fold pyridoxal phosphate-dependent enzyme [Bacteriovoracaceae bacterium]|jgi:aspartate aminotransferase|nr:aminotransferase class I/II-fold pyridoxal phosphate-dependent enzyme [Bacteriovoracaceae bacterium]
MKRSVKLNRDIMSLKESATLAVNLAAKKLRKDGEDVYHFGFGQSPFPVHPKIQIALANNAHQKDYLPTRGLPELCSSISKYYKTLFDYNLPEDLIAIGPGSKELIFQILYILEGPVIVPAPSWVSYGPQLQIRGKEIVPIVTSRDKKYKLQANELKQCCENIQDDQKILILNNPSNPTGALYTDQEIKDLSQVCREENIIIISDEIYAQVNFSNRDYVGFHKYYPEGTMITAGLSKSHAAGGYRLGFISLPKGMEDVMKCLSAMISETFSAVSAPIQYAALETYCGDYDLIRYVDRCTKIHGAASLYLHYRFIKMGLNCPKPEGAFYLFPDFNNFSDKLKAKGLSDGVKLSQFLIDEYHVALLPGEDFYYPADYYGCRIASVDYDGDYVYQQSLINLFEGKADVDLDHKFIEKNCPNLKKGCDQIEKFLNDL